MGGILSIISGAFGFFHLVGAFLSVYMFRFMFTDSFTPYSAAPPPEFLTVMTVFYGTIGLGFALIGILAIVGGIFALKRKHWGLALAGSIAGTFTFFPCGIPAIIFVSMSQQEFSASGPAAPIN